MKLDNEDSPLVIVVGSGGTGKTTLAAAIGLNSAREGKNTLVMTFDPSLRLKDTLGVGDEARDREVRVETDTPGELRASLLDARATFDRLVERYAPDEASRRRILDNRFYNHLAGRLAGILEYMAVERLYEIWVGKRYDRIVLDTPPTRQAIDFLEAPDRIVSFLESGALKIALKPWFDVDGHLRGATKLGFIGKRLEAFLDRMVGLGLLRDMAEFFQAFGPLFDGFRQRAVEVQKLLRTRETKFVLVSGPDEERIPDTMFFARCLEEAEYQLGPVIVNRIHRRVPAPPESTTAGSVLDARRLLHWLGERDGAGLSRLRELLPGHPILALPLLPTVPSDLVSLKALGDVLAAEQSAVVGRPNPNQ
jgi:anion-transporting  ArsA/GET3 family ATPase